MMNGAEGKFGWKNRSGKWQEQVGRRRLRYDSLQDIYHEHGRRTRRSPVVGCWDPPSRHGIGFDAARVSSG